MNNITKSDDIGKNISWSELEQKYPAKWIIFKNAEWDGSDVVSGTVSAVLSDNQLQNYMEQHYDEIAYYTRTNEDMSMGGYIHGELVDA